MNRTMNRAGVISACVALLSCTADTAPNVDGGSLRAALVTSHPEIDAALVEVLADGVVVDSRTVSVGALPMPGGDVIGADAFFTLDPGSYRVRAVALDETGAPAEGCAEATTTADVAAGQTTEVTLSIVCTHPGSGGLDAIVIIGTNPVITELTFKASKFTRTCLPTVVTATVMDQPGQQVTLSWSLRSAPPGSRHTLEPVGSSMRFTSETEGTYQVQVTATDQQGLSSSLVFPIHVGVGRPGPCLRQPPTLDRRFTEVTWRAPEFGGAYVDREGDLVVVVTDMTDEVMARADRALRDILGADRELPTTTRFVSGRYNFAELMGARVRVSGMLGSLGVTRLGVSEILNRVKLGVSPSASRRAIAARLADLGIPSAMVVVEQAQPVAPLQNTNMIRPVVGGTQIALNGGGTCTLGFVGVRSGVRGYTTNSHCTNIQGGVEGTIHGQAGNSDPIGTETIDPNYTGGGNCPNGMLCRWSDSSWNTLNAGVTSQRGKVFRFGGGRHTIVAEYLNPLCGDTVTKVGRTTGVTSGEVIDTCEDVQMAGTNFVFFCQDRVEANSAGGDSGSPVMIRLPGPSSLRPAVAMGLLWGGSDGEFVFSNVSNIERGGELSNMNVKFGDNDPTVIITSPTTGGTIPFGAFNDTTLTAVTDDLEDGAGCCNVEWFSSVEGLIGSGLSLNYVFPTPGPRTITAVATDSFGNTRSDSVTVVTSNIPPMVTIAKPVSGDVFFRGLPEVLNAWAFDSEIFSNVPCNAIRWSSTNLADPFPAFGCNPQAVFLTNGFRVITVTASDAQGTMGSASVGFTVVDPPTGSPPIMSILSPVNNSAGQPNNFVTLLGTAQDSDNPAGNIDYRWLLTQGSSTTVLHTETGPSGGVSQFLWKPSDDVGFNCGGATVEITLEATDPEGTSTKSVNFNVLFPPC